MSIRNRFSGPHNNALEPAASDWHAFARGAAAAQRETLGGSGAQLTDEPDEPKAMFPGRYSQEELEQTAKELLEAQPVPPSAPSPPRPGRFAFPKQACVDCHFFVKEARGLPNGTVTLEITAAERDRCRSGDYDWAKNLALACHFGVWDEGHNFAKATRHELIVGVNRRRFCFYWKHRPGMLLPAAKILQQREAEARDATRDRRLTVWGLWVAVAALLINAYVQVAQSLHWWPFP